MNKIHACVRYLVALGFCAMIAVLVVMNTALVIPPIKACVKGETSFEAMTEKVASAYLVDAFRGKFRLLDLNGLFARLTGRRDYNGVTLLKNGMLGEGSGTFRKEKDHRPLANALTGFSKYLAEMDIPFLYVQAPYKMDINGKLLPDGLTDYWNMAIDELMAALERENVHMLDLRAPLTSDIETTERMFYRTDHHWTPDGAFKAFGMLMEHLRDNFYPELDVTYTDPQLWERHQKDNWFLGSQGKRVGSCFTGTDPLIWYTPKFETNMTCDIPKYNRHLEGDYVAANIRQQYIERCDYYALNAYCVYIGGDYPIVIHQNPEAPNRKRILILKDSFVLPLQTFMSTAFTEVDVIDPRHYKESIAEYCRQNRPDIVLMFVNGMALANQSYYELGVPS